MGQIVTLNKPSTLQKLGGALQGAGAAAWGMTDAKQLLEELQQEREKHKVFIDAQSQAIASYQARDAENAQRLQMDIEDRDAAIEQEKNVQNALKGTRLGATNEALKFMDPKDPRREEFLKEAARDDKIEAVNVATAKRKASLDRSTQPSARGNEPLFQPEQVQAWQTHIDEIAEIAKVDPEKAATMLDDLGDTIDTHADTVADERARVEHASKVFPQIELFIDSAAQNGADPMNVFRARKMLQAADVKNLEPEALQKVVNEAMAAAQGFDVPGAGKQGPGGGKGDSPFDIRSKAIELAQKDPDWAGRPKLNANGRPVLDKDGKPVMEESKSKAEIVRAYEHYLETGELPQSGGAEQAPASQAPAVSPGDSPAAPSQQMNGKAQPAQSPEQIQQTAVESAEALIAAAKRAAIGKSPEEAEKIKEAARKAYEAMTAKPGAKKKGLPTRKREDAAGRNQ